MSRLTSLGIALLRGLPPETAHHLALGLLRSGFGPHGAASDAPALRVGVGGLEFPNPVGLAAGFDKDAVALEGLFRLGFGFVEVGTVTPRPQPGNPRPRLFRLREDDALINRMGFNSGGLDAFVGRLSHWRERVARPGQIVGVNIGANRDSDDAVEDYAQGLLRAEPLADYVVVNVSSPNTPGLRRLQEGDELARLLDRLVSVRARSGASPPLLLKIAPDLDDAALEAFVARVLAAGISGLVVSNTTTARRASLRSQHRDEAGGLSGAPLRDLALDRLRATRRLTDGRIPLIGVGGIASADDAYARIRAGASLVQIYTGFVYQGPVLIERILGGLASLLNADGLAALQDAIGIESVEAGG